MAKGERLGLTPEEMKERRRAQRRASLEKFYAANPGRRVEYQREYRAKHKDRLVAAHRERRHKNPEVAFQTHRAQTLRKYGITQDQFDAMWDAQGGKCAACSAPLAMGVNGHAIDHCHTTGRVRKLLCGPCNVSLGLLKENPEALRALAAYAETVCVVH